MASPSHDAAEASVEEPWEAWTGGGETQAFCQDDVNDESDAPSLVHLCSNERGAPLRADAAACCRAAQAARRARGGGHGGEGRHARVNPRAA